jgi:hypothetical protein
LDALDAVSIDLAWSHWLQLHYLHQPLNALFIDHISCLAQPLCDFVIAVEGMASVFGINQAHQVSCFFILAYRTRIKPAQEMPSSLYCFTTSAIGGLAQSFLAIQRLCMPVFFIQPNLTFNCLTF